MAKVLDQLNLLKTDYDKYLSPKVNISDRKQLSEDHLQLQKSIYACTQEFYQSNKGDRLLLTDQRLVGHLVKEAKQLFDHLDYLSNLMELYLAKR